MAGLVCRALSRYAPRALDTTTPPEPVFAAPASPHSYAPGDLYARTDEEQRLCEQASTPDYLYLASTFVLAAGAVTADAVGFRTVSSAPVRTLGPGLIGLTWGFFVGGAPLTIPQCSPTWIPSAPVEGGSRKRWPLAISFAILAGVTAPVVVGIETGGTQPQEWTLEERQLRLILAGVVAAGAAFLPYLLPPKTLRAARALERVRAGADTTGFFIGYSTRF